MKMLKFFSLVFLSLLCVSGHLKAQDKTIARAWNEVVIESIRKDFARPTIHARNLYHTSAAMYTSWALFDGESQPYFPGIESDRFLSDLYSQVGVDLDNKAQVAEVISHAVYNLIMHRYKDAPGFLEIKKMADDLMGAYGFDASNISTDYTTNDPAALGNYIALFFIKYGLSDGANEQNGYDNQFYNPTNEPLDPTHSGINGIVDPNRWQPLLFNRFIDQSGNILPEAVPTFLSPEWGVVKSFAFEKDDYVKYNKDGFQYAVALDPGVPPLLEEETEAYQWGFSLVNKWSSHLDSDDTVMWDISPNQIGNIEYYPEKVSDYPAFYLEDGGDIGSGYQTNPVTGEPYEEQWVSRGDYTRVLAEFWADGPHSETPPGHWFTIINYVMDQPEFSRKYAGGEILEDLEYDVKAYLMLGGAMHDAAIAAWSVKGYYDYIRPISAIRYMASLGQSTDPNDLNYHKYGIPLEPGLVELIKSGDPDFPDPSLIGQIKLKAWKGPDYVDNPATEKAGVGWILAGDWWPYQRPSFVTPPFAGYVSGHSTYSRAAADVLAYITGSPYFPGGLGEFHAKKNEYLVFEEGPSVDVILQWASYRDASDQCSLSRIWGGIHPPADDIPGRNMGVLVSQKAIRRSNELFTASEGSVDQGASAKDLIVFPNPILQGGTVHIEGSFVYDHLEIVNTANQVVYSRDFEFPYFSVSTANLSQGLYFVVLRGKGTVVSQKLIVYE
ncbi:T9SS type A sorting domain-containing protein [Portibacter lacus]|uniref:T9SS type A sorting domain-containing protein n=1 Tax=Portibacter lacus TaxID=1099794 RepID=A0AA37WE67_9BACT|nr:T9SS type A sorting domain-containing protein [Portibacter lacus]GLR17593.1 hypothetical protein GCM10007940_22080 [Portibacter lacus]